VVVTFHLGYGGHSVKTPGHKYHVIQHLDGEITSWVGHVHHRAPAVRHRVVFLAAVHPRQTVEAADHVQMAMVRCARHAAPFGLHRRYRRPLVHDHVINLRRIHALLSVETDSYVYFVCTISLLLFDNNENIDPEAVQLFYVVQKRINFVILFTPFIGICRSTFYLPKSNIPPEYILLYSYRLNRVKMSEKCPDF